VFEQRYRGCALGVAPLLGVDHEVSCYRFLGLLLLRARWL
jgi:hypothetical protein